ncbi:ROK family protein [Roseicyclus mahoneyensis]|uniref:N-acylmannosamine kinase/N-acetylmannosamine-6-phosphate 2-epimerase/N-acetylmannosamine kinase n=1 Tax=Roseicyclus mahoneyensis TaxID=164332 RepID=A0A316GF22_9RHOB|nr:ROK family protein [Roseicyclus mahoneyensis]PWK59193.1 N-acylmannosamine kinase/N-acetylmannosamine-6-phosphate 2-epimerase/N-acetylmannosamine kinase [Roseicyclus mahoneyensis]
MLDPDYAPDGFAVDLGGTKIAAARIVQGQIVARASCATDAHAPPEAQVAVMAELARQVGYQTGAALGVAVAGRIDDRGHWHAVNTGTLSAIVEVPLTDLITRALGPANCMNDAAAAALAEARLGAGRGLRNFGYLTVSTGVGGGFVLGGRLLESRSGLAGHVGFTTAPGADEPCGSGRRGTVESLAGGRALAEAARRAGQVADARTICDAATQGEAWALHIVTVSARAIATLIADLTATLGLDAVAIGGSIGLADGYIDLVRDALDEAPAVFRVPITPAALGTDAPLFGALLRTTDRQGA